MAVIKPLINKKATNPQQRKSGVVETIFKSAVKTLQNVGKTAVNTLNVIGSEIGKKPLVSLPTTPFTKNVKSPSTRDIVQKISPDAPISAFLSGKTERVPGIISKNLQEQEKRQREFHQLSFTKKRTPQQEKRLKGLFGDQLNVVANVGGGRNDLNKATFYLRSKLDKEAANVLKSFAAHVELRGSRVAIPGDLGQKAQAIITDAFGADARNWSNTKMKRTIDLVLGKIGQGKNRAGLGLAVEELEQPSVTSQNAPRRLLNVAPPKKTSLLQQGFNRARNVISQQGEPGKQLAGKLQESRDIAETTAGKWVSQLPTVQKLKGKEFQNFVDVAEGREHPLNQRVAKAAEEWDKVRQDVYTTAKNLGLDIGKLENYFPHRFDPKMFEDKKTYAAAINHLVETGQAQNTTEAAKLLRNAQDVIRNRRQGNLEMERMVNLPMYEKTPKALFDYIEQAAERIGQVHSFGKDDTEALKLINQMADEGFDASTARSLFDISVGAQKYGETQKKISGVLRKYNAITKLGTGAITNVGQSVNTATVVGAIRTLLKAPGAALNPKAKEFALKAGVTLDGVINDLREGAGFSGKVLGSITAPGFNKVEKFNRTLAAWAGKDYADTLAKRAVNSRGARKVLAKMGLNAEEIVARGGKLTEEEQIKAARSIVERTQFKVDPQDLPGWVSSPWGKVVTQFKSFAYNQTAFLKREILDELAKGNVQPLVRFVAIGIPAGMGIQELKNLVRNRPSEEDSTARVVQGYSQAGGFGLAGDLYTGFFPQNKGYLSPERKAQMAQNALLGPTFGTATEALTSTNKALSGDSEDLQRFGLRQVPIAGGTLSNTLLPYKPGGRGGNQRGAKELEEIRKLPADKRTAWVVKLQKENPRLYSDVKREAKWQKLGVTEQDRRTANLGVANKERSKAIVKQLKKLKTPDEKEVYIVRLRDAGILTNEVLEQVRSINQK
jgi:hypothetical protein